MLLTAYATYLNARSEPGFFSSVVALPASDATRPAESVIA
jgi:hypothetical protein